MHLCDFNHEEIIHEYNTCPLCEANEELLQLRNEIEKLEEKYNELEENHDEYLYLLQEHNPELLI